MSSCNFSLSGIKEIKLAYHNDSNVNLTFPIYPTYNVTTGNISCTETSTGITIGNVTCKTIDIYPFFQSFSEDLVIDNSGRYYSRTLNLSSVYDENMDELLEHKHIIVFIVDNNNVKWVIGYDKPLKLNTYNLSSGIDRDGQNKYDLIYNSISYNRIKHYEIYKYAFIEVVSQDDGAPLDPTITVVYQVRFSTPSDTDTYFRIEYSNQDNTYYNAFNYTMPNGYTIYQWTAIYDKQGVTWDAFAHWYTPPAGYAHSLADVLVTVPTSYS